MTEPAHISAADYRRLLASGRPGAAWRGKVSKPADHRGIRFPSTIQKDVYARLCLLHPSALIIREPRIDLFSIAGKDGKPASTKPDFLVIQCAEWDHKEVHVEIHEAKGSKSAESRDWRLRAGAMLKSYPSVPMWVWRRKKKALIKVTLQEALSS